MGMIIRTVFNNKNWNGRCINADRDRRLYKCKDKIFKTGYKVDKNSNCIADCWESTLCKKYYWVNSLGNYDVSKAKGNVFFVYQDIDNYLVLWGKSKIENVSGDKVYFNKFTPMPEESRFGNISGKTLLGKHWLSGTFRYIDKGIESYLTKLITLKVDAIDEPVELDISDREGKELLKTHLLKERSARLILAFKRSLKNYNCTICEFDFEKTYGVLGRQFIEAHHHKPVAYLKENEKVSIKDFIGVCSNCHRMIHRKVPPIKLERLKKLICK